MKGEGYAIKNCGPEINQERNDYNTLELFLITCGKMNFMNARRSEKPNDNAASICPPEILSEPLFISVNTEILNTIEKTTTATALEGKFKLPNTT